MLLESIAPETADFISNVRGLIQTRVAEVVSAVNVKSNVAQLMPGKMLRTTLAARIADCAELSLSRRSVELACAATEMAHTASLLHDDVVDRGMIRRDQPTFWRSTGASAAVLIGDQLLCEALKILLGLDGERYAMIFVQKLQEVCAAEAEHELLLRDRRLEEATCLRIARGKTGPLFAFVAQICGGSDKNLSSALEEAGYIIGTAYQLADDLIDVVGSEAAAGKTLGTDLSRGKYTIPQSEFDGETVTLEYISEFSESALDLLDSWEDVRTAVADFLALDFRSVLERHLESTVLPAGPAS